MKGREQFFDLLIEYKVKKAEYAKRSEEFPEGYKSVYHYVAGIVDGLQMALTQTGEYLNFLEYEAKPKESRD